MKYTILLSFAFMQSLCGSPTSLFWTNCTTDVVADKVWHIDVDNYFSVDNRARNGSSFPPDIGVKVGTYSNNYIKSEAGIDYLGGEKDPFLFNGKLAVSEGKLFDAAPSLSIGVFNVGTTRVRNQQVFDAVIGYTLPQSIGQIFAGGYHGKRSLGTKRSGWMVGYQKNYDKWWLAADYASGKNAIGGGGVGIGYFFTPKINILTGPVWFNDIKANGIWKWSVQLGIDL